MSETVPRRDVCAWVTDHDRELDLGRRCHALVECGSALTTLVAGTAAARAGVPAGCTTVLCDGPSGTTPGAPGDER